jgi:hypothetical protein
MNQEAADTIGRHSDVLVLARALAAAESRCTALAQRRRWPWLALAVAGILGFAAGAYVTTPAGAQISASPAQPVQVPVPVAAPTHDELMGQLPPAERARLQEFEQKVAWVSQYMRSNPDFDAGAAIALFLGSMATAMESVPRMQAEMETMNAKLNALPFMANEVAGMNAKMGVMAANMDSTMGRAGRMMPFGW